VIIKDINGDKEEEIIDVVRSAGVNDLGKNEDSVAALSKK